MSQSQQINRADFQLDVAPTPQNTPLDTQVLANRPANQGKPQVEDIGEGEEDDEDQDEPEGANPASLLAKVSLPSKRYGLDIESSGYRRWKRATSADPTTCSIRAIPQRID